MTVLFELFRDHPPFYWSFIGMLGLFVGSFLNVVIARVPAMLFAELEHDTESAEKLNLFFPRSHCPQCKSTIAWFYNVPILSFLYLKGKCAQCKTRISVQYPVVELLTAVLSTIIAIRFGLTTTTLVSLPLIWALISLSFIDLNHTILPDTITLPVLWLGLFVNTFGIFVTPISAIQGALCGYLSLWFIFWVFKWITQKDGIGYGDFKLFALLGAWFGWQSLPIIILISSILGSIVGLTLIYFKNKTKNFQIPFGPFLAIGGLSQLLLDPATFYQYFTL